MSSAAVQLASKLVRMDTVNPPGREAVAARYLQQRLAPLGIDISLHELSPGRESLIARHHGTHGGPALCFSGHLDTVPLGVTAWSRDPHSGEIDGDRLWGRGSTDMKGGIAAMVVAFERLCRRGIKRPVTLALTASEETGCQGAGSIAGLVGPVAALLIAEPTSEKVAIAHKGVLWLRFKAFGKAAHGSKPELGQNAIERMMSALTTARGIEFKVPSHPLLGRPTSSIGTIAGGTATNMVPDRCEATLDVRLTPGLEAARVLADIRSRMDDCIELETVLALEAVQSPVGEPWLESVITNVRRICGGHMQPTSATFFTDASVLVPALGYPPTAIIGPGDPALAHQVDEWCSIAAIDRTTDLYEQVGLQFT